MKSAIKPLLSLVLLAYCLRIVFADIPVLPSGTDWSQYIMGAEVIWNFEPSLHYPEWRKPFYSYLLGLFGGASYLRSGRILAAIGFLFSLTALIVWFWRRSWLLALTLGVVFSLHPLVVDGMNYLNPYPLMGGLVLLGAVFSLRERAGKMSLFTGGFGVGAAVIMDGRAWILLVCIGMFFLWKRYSAQKWLVWSLGMLPLFAFHSWLISTFTLELLSLTDQLWEQRAFLFREDMEFQLFPFHKDNALVAGYCVGESQYITLDWFFSDCMRWLAVTNWDAIQSVGILPVWGILAGLFALTIRKSQLLSFWGVVIVSLSFSLLLWAPPRYYFLSIGALVLLLGEGCLIFGTRVWTQILICGGISWLWFSQVSVFESKDYPREWEMILPRIVSVVGENQLLDCSQKDLWLVHSSTRRADKRALFLSPKQCSAVLEAGQFSFLLLSDEYGEQISQHRWKERERFQIHRDTIILYQDINISSENRH